MAADDRRQSDREARDLDDFTDREELRQRYYGLLQELRVVLPGVQVLMAFLLTAPFARRFADLDDAGRRSYLVALLSALGSIICLLAPTVFHRVAERTARAARLVWGVRFAVAGVVLLAVSLTSASWCVTRLVFGTTAAAVVAAVAVAAFVVVWVAVPVAVGRRSGHKRQSVVEVIGQTEEREHPRCVEVEREVGDAIAGDTEQL